MFRTDRDALADKLEELRLENERLRAENEAMRGEVLARRAGDPGFGRNAVYRSATLHDADRVALARHRLESFPIWATVVTHLLTLGVASAVRFNLNHDRLPKVEHDDPSAFKAIAFLLIPYFNFYWVFFNGLRLVDRVNLQLRLRGEQTGVSRDLTIAAGVASVLPYVNFLLAPLVWLPVAIQMQRAVNRIVELDAERAAKGATQVRLPELLVPAQGVEPVAGMFQPPPSPEVAPRDVVAEAEAEADALLAQEESASARSARA